MIALSSYFNCSFYCVFNIGNAKSIIFAYPKLIDDIFLNVSTDGST